MPLAIRTVSHHHMVVRTSVNSVIQIAEVLASGLDAGHVGRIGLTICPGKKDADRGWNRDLKTDLQIIRNWEAAVVVTLMESHEMELLQVQHMPWLVRELGMRWVHLPIRDVDVPDHHFKRQWKSHGTALHDILDSGENILVHCRGGLGRSGLVVAQMLVERGVSATQAVHDVRKARPGAIETRQQEIYVHQCSNGHAEICLNDAEIEM